MGREGFVAAVVIAAICVSSSARASMPGSSTAQPVCGSPKAATLIEGPRSRVFERDEMLFACLHGRAPRHLSAAGTKWGIGKALPETVELNELWVASVQEFQGVDGGRFTVRAMNLATGRSRTCGAGYYSAVMGAKTRIGPLNLSPTGLTAWGAVVGPLRQKSGKTFLNTQEVVGCSSAAERIVFDTGPGIDLGSVRVRLQTVYWTDNGEKRSARLNKTLPTTDPIP